ncbi:type I polyketide synthase, partial [Kitasatospora sp. NPDC004272]
MGGKLEDVRTDLVAIVGMAARFPRAADLPEFWELLISGGDAVGPVPPDRWNPADVVDPTREIQAVGGFLDGVDRFDAEFFGISPREAEVLDPQQRLMLETVWRTLEDAGHPAADLRGTRTGVYMGALWHDHELLRKDRGAGATQHSIVGNSLDILSARVSYVLGLTGPSLTVESSCSSSLVALHQACQALRHGEVEAALVGGSNLMLTPEVTVGLTHFGGLSPTGRCHAFGAGADGFVRGEGVAAVYLKRLDRALRDGDRVRAVVVASAVNNDGGGDSLVTPNPAAQCDLLERVYGGGAVPPDALAYVEAHGTGTVRGDGAEASALGRVLGRARTAGPLHIGSVKTNIGHLEPAAGLAGLIKSVLSLEHGVVPASLHAEELNPDIDFAGLNLAVAREPLALAPGSHIGVNSFGWGGTNAHVVVTAAPDRDPAPEEPGEAGDEDGAAPFLLPLSGHTGAALERREADLRERLAAGAPARGLARTLAWRRDHFAERRALIGPELVEAAAGRAREVGRVAFVFPGQGAQWTGMGAGLYGHDAAFTAAMDGCAEALSRHVDWDVRELVTGAADTSTVERVQPALWAMSVSLAAAWTAAGVRPDLVIGHSQGEIAAATVAGSLSLADGALVVSRRSELLRQVAGFGRMLAVDLGPEEALAALEGFEGLVELAVHNGPRSCVLSGDGESVLLLKEILEADGVFCRLVDVDYGSHSPQIDALAPTIEAALEPVRPRPARIPMLSTVDLADLAGTEVGARYWAENLRRRVRFAEAVERLLDEGVTHLVEISPHPGLGAALRQAGDARPEPPAVLGTLRRGEGAHRDLLGAFGRAYVSGLDVRGPRPAAGEPVAVPPYPFQGTRHWVRPARGGAPAAGRLALALAPSTARGVWEGTTALGLDAHPWLADHRVHDAVVLPAGGYLALFQHALADRAHGPLVLRDVRLPSALALGAEPVRLAVTWRPGAGSAGLLAAASAHEGGWTGHCRARASWGGPVEFRAFPGHLLDAKESDAEEFYRRCAERGLGYGPAFRPVVRAHVADGQALVELVRPAGARSGELAQALHPVLWDGVLQAALAAGEGPCVPVALASAVLDAPGAERLWVHARRRGELFDLDVFDAGRNPVGRLDGLELTALPAGRRDADDPAGDVYRTEFEPSARPDPSAPAGTVVCARTDLLPGAAGLDALAGAGTAVFLAPVFPAPEGGAAGTVEQVEQAGLVELAGLVRRCLAENPSVRLAVVTRDGDPAAGGYPGFLAVLQAEYPQFAARLIETDLPLPQGADRLMAELAAGEDRVVLRGGERLVGRRVRGGASRT